MSEPRFRLTIRSRPNSVPARVMDFRFRSMWSCLPKICVGVTQVERFLRRIQREALPRARSVTLMASCEWRGLNHREAFAASADAFVAMGNRVRLAILG